MTIGLAFASDESKAQRAYLDVNEKVDQYPKVQWLKGEPVPEFNKDKIYVIELWATWCRPCVAAMPHLNEMALKFKDKITFIGQDVWEEDIEKVRTFLSKNNAITNYSIAFAGPQGSDFDKNWTKPSGTSGIPRTFVIQNNTLVWMTTPEKLSEEVLQLLVDKKFSIEEAERLQKKK